MRLVRYPKWTCLIILALLNVVILYRIYTTFFSNDGTPISNVPTIRTTTKPPLRHISKLVTVVVRDFELNENDVSATVQSFLNIFPNIQVLIVCNGLPYPPLEVLYSNTTSKNVKLVNLANDFYTSYSNTYPLAYIKTKYALFVPDSTRVINRQSISLMVNQLAKSSNVLIASQYVNKKNLECLEVEVNRKEWSLKYKQVQNTICDAVSGKHLILVETDILKTLNDAFLMPFPQALYLQAAVLNYKVRIFNGATFQDGKPIFRSHHAHWKIQQLHKDREKYLYDKFKIKQVIRPNGQIDWFGCVREKPRCFPPVVDSMPSYLFEGKWTPPCCLANLRKTASHVFQILDDTGVRYWLESGSLLGAMRSGDILPWDHDVDIGFNRDDIGHCVWLEKARIKPVMDKKGFIWEKATEGNFFRVLYSKNNRIYVNLFPFYNRNGTMTKDSWFTSHRNMEFPELYLHPMSSIEFIGRHVPSPNNIRDFLELKFGKGAIENPQYPDPSKLKFP